MSLALKSHLVELPCDFVPPVFVGVVPLFRALTTATDPQTSFSFSSALPFDFFLSFSSEGHPSRLLMLSCGLNSNGQWTHTTYFAYARTTRQHHSCGLGPNGHELMGKFSRTYEPQDGIRAPTHPAHFQTGSFSRVQMAPMILDGFREPMPRSPTFSAGAWMASFRAVSITSSKFLWKLVWSLKSFFCSVGAESTQQAPVPHRAPQCHD